MPSRRYPSFPIPGVGAVVFGSKGILLVRRDKEPGKGLWSIPGGGVEIGETQEQALVREVFEETGVECRTIKLLSTTDIIYPDEGGKIEYHYLLNHYVVEALTEDIIPESPEAEVKWFNIDDLPYAEMPKAILDVIKQAKTEFR